MFQERRAKSPNVVVRIGSLTYSGNHLSPKCQFTVERRQQLRSKFFLIASPLMKRLEVSSNFVLSVKDNLYNAKDLVSLVWVQAHAGNPGNELADHFAKIASSCGDYMPIPAPYSCVKRVCKEFLVKLILEKLHHW
ncbi:hypothetical protein AVEN_76493-1 [Araneus ventricosus]|uniref:RNase H type-1 domain-containing protein n=1 Tax=Araneus ventricosus TaxID=182803 RepID=A0A4Y2CDE8_ARAVE|nr:hypothetical protein AVEN_76493-1 [Araneus ventricosus]